MFESEGLTIIKALKQPDGKYYVEALADSSAEKPTNVADHSLIAETDTGDVYKLLNGTWSKFGEG